jgi:glutamate/aspartate transport system substrate-binding protein
VTANRVAAHAPTCSPTSEQDFQLETLSGGELTMLKNLKMFSGVALLAIACSAMADDLGPTLQKIKDTGIISLGVRYDSPPFNYNLGGNQQAGYSYDISTKIVDAIKQQLKIPALQVKELSVTSQNRIALLMNGTIDLECGTTTNNLEREKQVAFSTTIFIIGTRLLVKKDSGIKEWSDLKDHNVVAAAGSTGERLLRGMNDKDKLGMNIIGAKDVGEAFLMLETGRAAAYMDDDAILYAERAKAKSPKDWLVVARPFTREAYGCMLRKNDEPFKKLVDNVISGMMKDGTVNRLYTKWFLQPIPPRGFNVDFPMSSDMKALIVNPNDRALDE